MNSLFSLLQKLWETFGLFYKIKFVCRYRRSSKRVHRWDGSSRQPVHEKWSERQIIPKGEHVRVCVRRAFPFILKFTVRWSHWKGYSDRISQLHRARLRSLLQMDWLLKWKRDLFLLSYRSYCFPRIGSLSIPTLEIPYCTQGGVLCDCRHTADHWAAPRD